MSIHLLAEVSGHGFGHLAQIAPVLRRLGERVSDLRLTIRTALPRRLLETRLARPFDLCVREVDVGLCMRSAVEIDVEASAAAYRAFHRDWRAQVEAESETLRRIAPDLVLTDVSYRALAGAAGAGIPAIAMSSLNWADVRRRCLPAAADGDPIHDEIVESYRCAAAFLLLEPAMAVPWHPAPVSVGPVAELGRRRPEHLRERAGAAESERIVLVTTGGIPTVRESAGWRLPPRARIVVPAALGGGRDGTVAFESLGMRFVDVLASCDALVTKSGYGSYVEAACHGVPVVYTPRPDWPEEPALSAWLATHVPAAEIAWTDLMRGDLAEALESVWSEPPRPPVAPRGVDEAAAIILSTLRGRPSSAGRRDAPPGPG